MRRKRTLIIIGVCLTLNLVGLSGCVRNLAESRSARTDAAKTKPVEAPIVQVASPERHDLARQIALPASVEAFEQATLYAKTAGYLKWIKVDIGDRVRQGNVLALIDAPEMAQEATGAEAEVERAAANIGNTQAEAERAKAELELKKLTYERLKSIREQERDVIPQQEVDEAKAQFDVAQAMVKVAESKIKVARSEAAKAEAARARLATLMAYAKIIAPFDGVVIKRHVDPGAMIQQASSQTNVSPVVTIARMETLRVFVDVPEPEVRLIKKGAPALLAVEALPGKVYQGACARFATALDPKTRTMRAEIDLPNRDGLLRPGMYGNVRLTLERRANALTVPSSALVAEGGKTYVYTVADGKVKRVEVMTGLDDGIQVELTGGVTGNERIIVTGKGAVKDGAPVKVART